MGIVLQIGKGAGMNKMTKQGRKRVVTGLLAMTLAAVMPGTAFAGQWHHDDMSGWWYQREDNSYPAGQWEQINGIWYYFYGDGYMAADTQTPDGYYVDGNGAWMPGYSTPRLTAWEVANILYCTNEPLQPYGAIMMEIGQFSGDGTIYASFMGEDGEYLWYGVYAEEKAYGEDGITIVFHRSFEEYRADNTIEVTWYGREAADFPSVSGADAGGIMGDYSYFSMVYGG